MGFVKVPKALVHVVPIVLPQLPLAETEFVKALRPVRVVLPTVLPLQLAEMESAKVLKLIAVVLLIVLLP